MKNGSKKKLVFTAQDYCITIIMIIFSISGNSTIMCQATKNHLKSLKF
jgi:hypothetical protein